jgi:PAS domain S-box-containing protein
MRDQGALGGAEEQYRLLMGSLTDHAILMLDNDGRVAGWNLAAERLFGYGAAEVLGQPLDLFFTAEDRAQGLAAHELHTAVTTGRAEAQGWNVRKDGSRFWAIGSTTALRDEAGRLRGFAKVCRDRTEQRRIRDALEASERRYRALVENAWDGVTLVAADGTILETTPSTFRGLGYTPEEYLGRNAFELFHPEDVPAVEAMRLRLLEHPQEKFTIQYRLRHKNGSWRWVEAAGVNLLGDSSVRAIVVNHRDVTAQREAEERLRQADRKKDEFLAVLGHELRNPLAPIRNAVEVLRLRGQEGELSWAAEVIDRQVRHLTRLVDDLLDIARITRGKVELRKERVELARVIANAVETSAPLIEARRHRLDVTLAAEPVWLEVDPTRLAQAVGNLLTNAAKYTAEGGHIQLTAERCGHDVVLRVRDNGIGIRAEMVPCLFELFTQGRSAFHQAQGGLGLGLTLVRALVELHGGGVEAHSKGPGRGSEFVLRLPLSARDPAAGAREETGGSSLTPPRDPALRRRILVVDDNVDAAQSMALLLRLAGHEVRTVHEGSAVLATAREFRPDVVLLDLALPDGVTGYDLAPQLRRLPELNGMLLVALTGYGQEEDKERTRQAGFDAHVVKPADPQVLHNLLESVPS